MWWFLYGLGKILRDFLCFCILHFEAIDGQVAFTIIFLLSSDCFFFFLFSCICSLGNVWDLNTFFFFCVLVFFSFQYLVLMIVKNTAKVGTMVLTALRITAILVHGLFCSGTRIGRLPP
jgi:hypothetical protein